MNVMSPAQVVTATRPLMCAPTMQLGILLWYLIHADAAVTDLSSTKIRVNIEGTVAIYRHEQTEFGREIGRDAIDWWINRKETNLAEFSGRAAIALKSAQTLKERSVSLKKLEVEHYEGLIDQIKAFATQHSDDIGEVLSFANWLHCRHPLAPSILFNYKVWGSSRMGDRTIPITQSAGSPEAEDPEILAKVAETVWGLQTRGMYTYVHSAFDIVADSYDNLSNHNHLLSASRVVRQTAREVTDQCATFFEFLRNSLRDIEKELEERSTRESRITSQAFWQTFIAKARKTAKAESLSWDFKQTLSFWHTSSIDARRLEKTKVAADLASFANAEGGCLIVGITDDRKVVGVSDDPREIESRLTITHAAIRAHFSYPRDVCRIVQVSVANDNGLEKVCFVLAVPKTCEPAAATDGKGSYIYPQRTGSGTIKADKDLLQSSRIQEKHDTYEFLDELDQFAL